MTFAFTTTALPAGRGVAVRPTADDAPLTVADAIRRWRHDAAFRAAFAAGLAAAPFVAYRWETPPVTAATADRPFDFALIDDPSLDRPADPVAFADLPSVADPVATFPNLGRNATLVAPGRSARPTRTWPRSPGSPRPTSSRPSGKPSATQWQPASAPRRSGSTPPEPASRSCTSGSTTGRSITATARTRGCDEARANERRSPLQHSLQERGRLLPHLGPAGREPVA